MTVSLWQDTAAWPGQIEHRRETADVCVVGGGIVGATLAKLLGEAGMSVVVLEAGTVGGGASGRNAGHCIGGMRNSYHRAIERFGHDRARELRAFLLGSRALVRGWCDQYAVPYEANGSQYLGIDAAEADELRASARALLADGAEIEFSEQDPYERGFVGRLYQPGDLGLQPYLLVTRLMAASGALVLENSAARAIEQAGETVTLRSRSATVTCKQAILATNAYSRTLHPYFRDRVFPTRAQMYATAPSTEPRLLTMPTGTQDGFEYFRQLADGRFLIGGYRDRFADEEVGYGDETTPQLQAGLEGWVRERFPEVAQLPITHRWAGTMGFTPDALPIIGQLPDLPNVYFAVGFTGSGMSFGPATARAAAEYMLDGTHPGLLHVERLG
jgi:glycine/D-amino acid oxidase-like deaminating enzyme